MRRVVDGDLDVACPLCGAQPGMNCVSTRGGQPFTGSVHRERRREAERGDMGLREAEEAFADMMFDADPSIRPVGYVPTWERRDGSGLANEGSHEMDILSAPPGV